jgi:hypothetical protein
VGKKCGLENKRQVNKEEVEKYFNSNNICFLEANAFEYF